LLGVLLVAAGIAGFFYNGTLTSNERIHDDLLGAFAVNGWSSTLHILLGIWGLTVRRPGRARATSATRPAFCSSPSARGGSSSAEASRS